MQTIHSFKHYLLCLIAVGAALLTSCSSDDDATLQALTGSPIGVTATTVSSLTFAWDEVENATQYGCTLTDAEGNVVDGCVTTEREVTFTGLKDDRDYTLSVTAFAAYGNGTYANAEPMTLVGHTDKILPLEAPALTAEVKAERINVSWDAVENAEYYRVAVITEGDTVQTDSITTTTYAYTGEVGKVYTVSVCADTDAEAYSRSEWASVEGLEPVKAERQELWRVDGSFYDAGVYGQTSTRTLVAYDDGSYELLDWVYAGSGCHLQFSVNADGTINVLNGGTPYGSYIPVDYYPGGYTCYIYDGAGYSSFSAEEGSLWFYAYGTTAGYSQFTWSPDDVVYAGAKEIWRVTGQFYDAGVYGQTSERTLVAYDDGTYELLDWVYAGSGCNLQFSVNADGTINVLNGGEPYGSYIPVDYYPGGYTCYIYDGAGYSSFSAEEGSLWFYAYGTTAGYSQFTWSPDDVVTK